MKTTTDRECLQLQGAAYADYFFWVYVDVDVDELMKEAGVEYP
jgi:hypothetical protein